MVLPLVTATDDNEGTDGLYKGPDNRLCGMTAGVDDPEPRGIYGGLARFDFDLMDIGKWE